jgi:hypothetical protein
MASQNILYITIYENIRIQNYVGVNGSSSPGRTVLCEKRLFMPVLL